jgi:peptidoglycan hydrolase CwlO-like protein
MSIIYSGQIRREPKHTCPLIDSVIGILEANFGNKDGSIETMEEIRTNCSELRDWGSEWKEYAEYCEEQSKDYENEVDELKEENSDKDDMIKDLNNEIYKLEQQIKELERDIQFNYRKLEE